VSGTTEKTWADFIACEEDFPRHLVRPTVWPPVRVGLDANPNVALLCVRCGTNCITYAGHATGHLGGIEVELPAGTAA
jgi:hypothetical protein